MSKVKPYDVGFGAPPKQHQWKKGQSGNPSGKKKPKVAAEPAAPLLDCMMHKLAEVVTISVNGEAKQVPMGEAIVTKYLHDLMSAPLKEKTKSLQVLSSLGVLLPPTPANTDHPTDGQYYSEEDLRVIQALLDDDDDGNA